MTPSASLRSADFPFCRCATSSPGRGKSALKGAPLNCVGNFAAAAKAVPLGKVAANAVSRRKGFPLRLSPEKANRKNSKASLKREREYHPL